MRSSWPSALEVNFGDCAEQIQIGIPYYTIEPLVKKMQARRQKDSAFATIEKQQAAWSGSYEHIGVPVSRRMGRGFEIPLREIASLRVGDILEMPASLLQQTRILLNGAPKFVGVVGLDGETVAVQIARKITSP